LLRILGSDRKTGYPEGIRRRFGKPVKTSRRKFLAGVSAVVPLDYLSSGETAAAEGTAIPDYFGNPGLRSFMFSGGRIQLSAKVMDEGEDVIAGEITRKVLHAHS
jgi:hypothetical protein